MKSSRAGGKYTPKKGDLLVGKNRLKQQSLAALTFQQRSALQSETCSSHFEKSSCTDVSQGFLSFPTARSSAPSAYMFEQTANCRNILREEGREGRLVECVPPLDVLQL